MRACLILGLIVSALAAGAPAHAQPKEPKAPTSQTIYANLQSEVKAKPFQNAMKFKDLLEGLNDQLPQGRKVTMVVADEAYRDEAPEGPDIYELEVRIRTLSAKMSALQVLQHAVKQLPRSALIVRAGKVEIVPAARATKEWMLNQTFNAEFKERPVEAALEELSELTGVSIVVDGRAKDKAKSAVSARFRDDVALQDAVRMLTDMAELKIVYMVTGIYITTPEHAQVMTKELKQLYGVTSAPTMGGLFGGGLGIGGLGMIGGGAGVAPPPDPIVESPLAPPLPPTPGRQKGGQ